MKVTQTAKRNRTRQEFLLTFFNGDGYEQKEVNGFVLVKHINGDTQLWEVAIYSKEAFKNFEIIKEQHKLL